MLIKFDRGNIAEHYKKRFAECLRAEDFEGAIDYLLKFHKERRSSDFHLALGMLYLQMTAQSDDLELFTMAYREFLLHIRRHPDCRAAYRNVMATAFLYHDREQMLECGRWILSDDMGLDDILCELDVAGLVYFVEPDYGSIVISDIFSPGEYGEIDPFSQPSEQQSNFIIEEESKRGGVIPFGGNRAVEPETHSERRGKKRKSDGEKVLRPEFTAHAHGELYEALDGLLSSLGIDKDSTGGDDLDEDETALLDLMRDIADEYEDEDDEPSITDAFLDMLDRPDDEEEPSGRIRDVKPEDAFRRHIAEAERLHDEGRPDAALAEIDKIRSEGDAAFDYGMFVMRACFAIDGKNYERAQTELNKAFAAKPHGALATTTLCKLYEETDRTDLISETIRSVDIKDFTDGAHVFKAFAIAFAYCTKSEALEFTERLIEEYNLLDMRRIYAQLLYNHGDRDRARRELYKLTRLYYDDINVLYFYLVARMRMEKMPETDEAPQEVLAALVETLMDAAHDGKSELLRFMRDDSISPYGLEFFLSLEFKNERKLLCRMFDSLRLIAAVPEMRDVMCDALVSPYVEPIVKAVIMSELYAKKHNQTLLAEVGYCPRTYRGDPLGRGYSAGYYTAFSMYVMLGRKLHDMADFYITAERVRQGIRIARANVEERAIAFYVFKSAWETQKRAEDYDERVCYAFGFSTKTEAMRAFRALDKLLKNKK